VRRIFTGSFGAIAVLALSGAIPAGANAPGPAPGINPGSHIVFGKSVLAPMAYTRFCLRYKGECLARPPIIFRSALRPMTGDRWGELHAVNIQVNRAIRYQNSLNAAPLEQWTIAPKHGICNDYAVTKRHELMRLGWPRRALLLAEVATAGSVNHTVLVVRTSEGDVVLDSMTPAIRRWSATSYRWIRIQSPDHPRLWAKVGGPGIPTGLSFSE
jgi:predicted transglutaminase-like cysteine proteinase